MASVSSLTFHSHSSFVYPPHHPLSTVRLTIARHIGTWTIDARNNVSRWTEEACDHGYLIFFAANGFKCVDNNGAINGGHGGVGWVGRHRNASRRIKWETVRWFRLNGDCYVAVCCQPISTSMTVRVGQWRHETTVFPQTSRQMAQLWRHRSVFDPSTLDDIWPQGVDWTDVVDVVTWFTHWPCTRGRQPTWSMTAVTRCVLKE